MANPEPPTPLPDLPGRNARGEWRPAKGIEYAPLFKWPWKPLAVIKWFFTYPGFAWPINSLLLLISVASWFVWHPSLEQTAHFNWDWMLGCWVRNQILIWGFYGAYYTWLYIWKKEGLKTKYDAKWPSRNSKQFLFGDQVKDNIFWTAGVSGLIWTALEWVTLWMYGNHKLPTITWEEHPVWFVAWIILLPIFREFHFYWIHRAIHLKAIYRHIHALHHKNVNPNPWSGMAMHPVEGFAYLSVCLIHWIVPSHPFHFMFCLQHAGLGPAHGHHGFDGPLADGKFPTGSYFHYLHHRYFECNYGEAMLPFDKWFGTFRDGTPNGAGSKLKEEHKYSDKPKAAEPAAAE